MFSATSILTVENVHTLTEWAWIFTCLALSLVPFSKTLQEYSASGKLLESRKKTPWSVPAKYIIISSYPAGLLVLLIATISLWNRGSQLYWTWTLMFLFQLSRRSYESLFIHSYSEKWVSVFQLPAAWWYYTQVVLGMTSTLAMHPTQISPLQTLLAVVVCLFGSYHQHKCHIILRDLRKDPKVRYAIPHGDWFQYVSTPHYLAEIFVYSSFVILAPQFTMSWLILIFVILNLGVTAHRTHKWYQEKFEDYPKHRKAMIPFLF